LLKVVRKVRVPNLSDEEANGFSENYKDIRSIKDEILKTDNDIDEIVFKLYGLNKEEIKIIIENTK
jgi:hypothetical protein